MTPSRKSSDFKIHADSSCASDSTDIKEPSTTSNEIDENIIHDGSEKSVDESWGKAKKSEEEVRKKFGDAKTEALIRAAAQDVVAKMELEQAGLDVESLLSARTGDDASEFTHGDGTEISYTNTELSENGDHTEVSDTEDASHDEGTEITYGESTELSYDEGTELTYGEETEISYEGTEEGSEATNDDGTEIADDQEYEQEAAASESESGRTQRDIDDIFSPTDQRSGSSRNSLDWSHQTEITDPTEISEVQDHKSTHALDEMPEETEALQEADHEQIPSAIEQDSSQQISESPVSEISTMPLDEEPEYTPSKPSGQFRPPFRTPSSVRAIQMSSPTPSVINGRCSPNTPRTRSRASHDSTQSPRPSTSRTGTPSLYTPKLRMKVTPKPFTAKDEYPLVLLHVTVLPLRFFYSMLLDSGEPLPETIQPVQRTWRLLQDKLGDVILNRGILLPHPQDSYETLEEVLLEALELPVRKRGEILKCGHYLSASSADLERIVESPGSDAGNEDSDAYMSDDSKILANITTRRRDRHHVCPTCDRTVKIDKSKKKLPKERRFRVKVYASNGLMGAGAWQAAWREMERVDVEIEPFVREETVAELDNLQDLWTKHCEEMEKRAGDQRQRECDEQEHAYEQQQQQQIYEQQEYEQQQQVCEREATPDPEQEAEPQNIQDFAQEEAQMPEGEFQEPINEPEGKIEGQSITNPAEQLPAEEIQENLTESVKDVDGNAPMQETNSQIPSAKHLPRRSKSIQRPREVYGTGPEEKIKSARASVANSRPQSRHVNGDQPLFSNGQSSPVLAHALAARLQGLHSASSSCSPERLRSRMHSSSPSHSSGYGGMGIARAEPPSHPSVLSPYIGENDFAYGGNRPYSRDFTHSEEYNEKKDEYMRERLRRRTEKSNLPPRFGEGIDIQQPAQAGMAHETGRKAARNREGDTFLQLLTEAIKVALRDTKNVVILILGMLVLFFALRPADTADFSQSLGHNIIQENAVVPTPNIPRQFETYVEPVSYEYVYEEDFEVPTPKKVQVPKTKPKAMTGAPKPKTGKNPGINQVPGPKSQAERAPQVLKRTMTKPRSSEDSQPRVKARPDVVEEQEVEAEPEYLEVAEEEVEDVEEIQDEDELPMADFVDSESTDEETQNTISAASLDDMDIIPEDQNETDNETEIPERGAEEIEVPN